MGGRDEKDEMPKRKKETPNSLVVLAAARLRAQLRARVAVGDILGLFYELGLAVAAPAVVVF